MTTNVMQTDVTVSIVSFLFTSQDLIANAIYVKQ